MKHLTFCLFSLIALTSSFVAAEEKSTTIYLQPNTTQIFTEIYKPYGLLNPPEKNVFEEALYLDQATKNVILPMQPANQVVFDRASDILSTFHKKIGDLELYIDPSKPKPFFYTAAGSKHLIVALVYAIAMTEPEKKFVFVEQAPFYSGHSNAVNGIFNYPNVRFVSFHEPSEIKIAENETLVEIVTSPNNPDGKFRQPLTEAKIILADFVFASSAFGTDGTGYLEKNIQWIKKARADGKLIFSFNSASKQFGKTGTRCGYIWYPIYDSYAKSILKNFFGFISASTVAGGVSGLAEFLNLITAFNDLPDTGKNLRQDAYQSLSKRHEFVEKEISKRYPGSTIISVAGSPTFFAKIKDDRIPKKSASDIIFDDLNVVLNSGDTMGESAEFIRLNLSGYSQILAEFLNRLAKDKKYYEQDLLWVSKKSCPHHIVCGKKDSSTLYIANPADCFIEANATDGTIEIILPPFIDYQNIELAIKKTDFSANPILIHSENFKMTLNKQNEIVKVLWNQPLYMNGQFTVTSQSKE